MEVGRGPPQWLPSTPRQHLEAGPQSPRGWWRSATRRIGVWLTFAVTFHRALAVRDRNTSLQRMPRPAMFGPRIYDLCRFSGNTNQPNRFVRSGRCAERSGRVWRPVRIFLLRRMKWQGEDSRLFAILRLVKRLPAILNPVPPWCAVSSPPFPVLVSRRVKPCPWESDSCPQEPPRH